MAKRVVARTSHLARTTLPRLIVAGLYLLPSTSTSAQADKLSGSRHQSPISNTHRPSSNAHRLPSSGGLRERLGTPPWTIPEV